MYIVHVHIVDESERAPTDVGNDKDEDVSVRVYVRMHEALTALLQLSLPSIHTYGKRTLSLSLSVCVCVCVCASVDE